MRTKIVYIVLLIVFSGCITQRRCVKKFPSVPIKTRIEYVEKITTDTITFSADTLKIVTEVPCDNFEIEIENQELQAKLTILNKKLNAEIVKKQDTVYIKGKEIFKTEYIKEQLPAKKYCSTWVKVLAFIGGFWILVIIGYFIFYFRKII